MASTVDKDIMEPFHAIPNDLLSGPLPDETTDTLGGVDAGTHAANDPLSGLFAPTASPFHFSSNLGTPGDALNSTPQYSQGGPMQPPAGATMHAFDSHPLLLSSLQTSSVGGQSSFAQPLRPKSPLGASMLLPGHPDSPQLSSGQHSVRQFLPLGSASYGPATTDTGVGADTTQRGRSLGCPTQSLAEDLWPRQSPAAVDGAALGHGLDWGTPLPSTGARHTSRLGGVLSGAFCPAPAATSSPRSQGAYGCADEPLQGCDHGVGLLPGDAAAVWGRPQQLHPVEGSGVGLQGGELAGRWSDELRGIGPDPASLWVFAPPTGSAAERRNQDTMSGLGTAALRMHAAATAAPPVTALTGLERNTGQGLFAFGAPGASVFGGGGSSWSALPDPQPLPDRQADHGRDDGEGYGLMDMPAFLQQDLPYGEPTSTVDAAPELSTAHGPEMVVQDSVRSGAGSQWSDGSQSQRKQSEFNVYAAEFQVRRPRMNSKELCLPNDLIE